MRKLVVVRIVHTPADMGSMQEGLAQESMAKVGRDRWLANVGRIERFWDEAEKEIGSLGLDYGKVRIYQDGLPCGGDLGRKIVDETAARGSKNYRIVRRLLDKGATIEATESPELLVKEYGYIKGILSARTDEEKAGAIKLYDGAKDELIRQRDAFIAGRIDATLKDGETGLLFIGAAHDVRPKLAKDIEVKSLD